MNAAKLSGKDMKDKMMTLMAEHKKVDQDIIISRASITQAQERKRELDLLITTTSTNVINLGKDTVSYAAAIATATAKAQDKAIGDTTTYLLLYNNNLLINGTSICEQHATHGR